MILASWCLWAGHQGWTQDSFFVDLHLRKEKEVQKKAAGDLAVTS